MIPRNKIKYYRMAAGESQMELARAVGVNVTAVGHWERGIRSPRDGTKIKIARHYGVPVEKIFFVGETTF